MVIKGLPKSKSVFGLIIDKPNSDFTGGKVFQVMLFLPAANVTGKPIKSEYYFYTNSL